MLPVYANDPPQYSRHGHGHGYSHSGKSKQRRTTMRLILQALVVMSLLIPLSVIGVRWLSRRGTSSLSGSSAGDQSAGDGSRSLSTGSGASDALTGVAEGTGSVSEAGAAVGPVAGGGQHAGKRAKGGGGRKMKVEEVPLPGALLKHLVLVAGHAVYVGKDYSEATKESSWFLEDYQQVPGEAQSFVDHIRLGVEQAAADPDAMLLFSGGQTRLAAGPRSEGLSYWVVAEAAGWLNSTGVRGRSFTEEHARDSFENLLFSLCRFYELSGHYPEKVTVVSYTLKAQRFQTLHRTALLWPEAAFHFVGTPVPPAAKGAKAGEASTVTAFKQDPYGCTGTLLAKRLRRDPFAVGPIHPSRCPALRGLLQHCATTLYEGALPWTSQLQGVPGGGQWLTGRQRTAALP